MAAVTEPKVDKRKLKAIDPYQWIEKIEAWLSSGRFMSEFARQPGHPSLATVLKWQTTDPAIDQRIAQARERGEQTLFEQNLELADAEPPRDTNGRIDPGFVAWHKNRIWARMEMLKRINPRKYGDKVENTIQGPGGGPQQHEITINLIDSSHE